MKYEQLVESKYKMERKVLKVEVEVEVELELEVFKLHAGSGSAAMRRQQYSTKTLLSLCVMR